MTQQRSSSVPIEVASAARSYADLDDLIGAIELVHPIVAAIGEGCGVALPHVRWCVSERFAHDVNEILGHGHRPFTADRLGGEVAAKNMSASNGVRIIVLNAPVLLDSVASRSMADHVFLAAHEHAHVVQAVVREASGVLEGVPMPSQTLRQGWRSITRIVADEYRADLIASHVLGAVATVEQDGTPSRPASLADTWALNHLGGMEAIALDLHPELPDLVQQYREWRIDLDDMVMGLASATEQCATALAHWQATCETVGVEDPWRLGELWSAPATELYLRPLWDPIREVLEQTPLLPTPEEVRNSEPEMVAVGERAIQTFWAALGVTVTEMADGDHVAVEEPIR